MKRACSWAYILLTVTPLFLIASPQTKEGGCRRSTVEEFSPALAAKARAFLGELKSAIKTGDKQKVANLVRYPLDVYFEKGHRVVGGKAELLRDYDTLFPLIKKGSRAAGSWMSVCKLPGRDDW